MDIFPILIFLGVILSGGVYAQGIDPRFIGHFPDDCVGDASFCMTYCLSIDPGTVRARCARDMVSCICSNIRGQSIAVRFIQERVPQPHTTTTTTEPTTTTTTTTTPVPPPEFDYAPGEPVPILLECDGSELAADLCHEFCITQISATHGLCDRADQTCRCEGVSPAVVQPAPIPAVFYPRPTPPPTQAPVTPPPMTLQQYWNPITYGHPNYNYNPAAAPPLAPQPQPQPYPLQNGPWGGYMPMPLQPMHGSGPPQWGEQSEPYHTISEQWVNFPQPPPQQLHPYPEGGEVRMEATTMEPPPPLPIMPETSSEVSVTSTVEEVINPDNNHANHQIPPPPPVLERKRRSPGSAYSTVSSFGSHFFGDDSNSQIQGESCDVTNCGEACASSGLDGHRCIPKCVDDACLCLCKPRTSTPPMSTPSPRPTPPLSLTNFNSILDSKVSALLEDMLAQPVQIVNSKPYSDFSSPSTPSGGSISPHPSLGLGGLTYGINQSPMTQEQFLALFTPPPVLQF